MNDTDLLSLKSLVALTVADIELFLLMEKDHETFKVKRYSRRQIQNQLKATMSNVCKSLRHAGFDLDEPLLTQRPVVYGKSK